MERCDCEVPMDDGASWTWCVQGKDAGVPCVIVCVNSYQRQRVKTCMLVGDRYLATTDPGFGVGCLRGGLNCCNGQEEQEH